AVNDFYFEGPDFEYPMGNIQMLGKSKPEMYRGERPGETRLAPTWSLRDIANHAVDFWLSSEDLPRPDNRVTLEPDRTARLSYEPSSDVPAARRSSSRNPCRAPPACPP